MIREQTTPSARLHAARLGARIGDALGMPVHGLSHQNVRMYYKGIKELRDDEKRGIAAGTGTAHTARLRCLETALARETAPGACLGSLPRGTSDAAVVAVALAAHSEVLGTLDLAPQAYAAARAHAWAIAHLATADPASFDAAAFWAALRQQAAAAERQAGAPETLALRLGALTPHLGDFPLDLQDACGGTDEAPEQAWAFAVAMFTRNPLLVEGTLLSAVNVGGAAATVGALVGSLLGALHGAEAFPAEWRAGLVGW